MNSKTKKPKRVRKTAKTSIDGHKLLLQAAAKVGDAEVSTVVRDSKKIEEKARQGPLASFFEEICDLVAMVRDFARGRYRAIPFRSIAAAVGALLYVLSPLDLIPDFIPVVGYIDDAAVVAACVKLVRTDLDNYRIWAKA